MSNGFTQEGLYLLLNLIEFVLNIVFSVTNCVFLIFKLLLHYVFNVNMTEAPKKKKKTTNDQPNQTIAFRGVIDANWQKFLSSNLIMDKKTEKPAQENSKNQFSGTFRRARKKKNKDHDHVQNNLKTLNLTSNADSIANNVDKEVNSESNNVNGGVKNKDNSKKNRLTKFLAMDCEMVGIGYSGNDHMLARVSIVNKFGDCIYDKFVKAREEVKDYRTDISGVRKEDLLNGEDFTVVQKEVSELLRGRILVGHSLKNDLAVLFLSHPKRNIRDTSRYKPFRKITKGSTPSLKRLAKEILGIDIQSGEHSSVEDARAAMQLYCSVARQWEPTLADKRGKKKVNPDDE
ncbi:uncharacterized protein LOC118280973 [Spodoptera frugiperda]|uniref:RNA exonuclease 4 n=2 Tax=Spodoptera frugiperda TaxID=7108 RepID=A0A9R0ETW4_SPOFR|nr:uncharacterized protein LOC118280973 [Spodoptera frugiperda]